MNKSLGRFSLLALLALAPPGIPRATADDAAGLELEAPPETPNHFTLGYRMGFNISARFKSVGSFAAAGHFVPGAGNQPGNPGPPTGANFNRTYEDGYNWVDSTGNAFGYTSYWGYDHASQVQNNAVVMHSSSSTGVSTSGRDSDPLPGVELTYSREFMHKQRWHGGLEAGLGYTRVDIRDNQSLMGSADTISDAFALPPLPGGGLVVPPTPPYQGPYALSPNGNPLLTSSPTRTESLMATAIAGQRHFEADLFGLRLGPYVEFAVSRRVALELSGGFALSYVASDFKFTEAAGVPGLTTVNSAGANSHSDWLPGGYVAATATVAFSEKWGAFAGAQFQDLGQYTHNLGGRQAVLDLRNALFVSIGLSYAF